MKTQLSQADTLPVLQHVVFHSLVESCVVEMRVPDEHVTLLFMM
jgi:hypothetical protein